MIFNSDHWRKNIPVLAQSQKVYAIDLIGYGYSEKPSPSDFGSDSFYTFETWGAQLNDFCTDVVKDEAFFICNSIGGDQPSMILHNLNITICEKLHIIITNTPHTKFMIYCGCGILIHIC